MLVQQAFRILQTPMARYIAEELFREYQQSSSQEALSTLSDQRDLPDCDNFTELIKSLDIANCLRLFDRKWSDIFRKKLSKDYRTWSIELMGVRNRLAHIGGDDFNDDDTWRALDTMSRLCEAFDPDSAESIRALLRESRYGSAAGSTQIVETAPVETVKAPKTGGILPQGLLGLPNWRDVIEPHPDVAQGRYKNAEFAADLAQVSRGEGAFEYQDPVEFFARTYVTEGMSGLLVQALKRINGSDGEPVIQLKTAFGGGKTHSMLALYHLMRGRASLESIPNIKQVLKSAGFSTLPKANVAVLVGTALDPTKSRRPKKYPGITINTLWGEMAAQLAESVGDQNVYLHVKEADKKGVSPGSETLKNLFDQCGPCVILIDELVAYAKKLYGASGLPAGSFDNLITFIQEITEAARASKNSLVVASIPESDIEIGGEAGKVALETIEHTFGRMESIWKPVAANEGFEVVRRRLFLDCKNPAGRELVCKAFSKMYRENSDDFPIEAREVEYYNRMVSCYPIHPEVFDRLYEDWATLERFQRTRGVLRLMAAVIHELWMGADGGAMILPGSISMDVPNVRDELTRHLPEGWNAIVDREVDGKNSIPYQKDQTSSRYGKKLAARRVARAIMLGSAPTDRAQSVRGIESSRIRLGVVQPGETIADFNDALNTLHGSLAYLYSNPSYNRFWYDTRPTLRKTVEDRATQISPFDVEAEIEKRLRKIRLEKPFAGIHICPKSSLDVPDEQSARIVILRPEDKHKNGEPKSVALARAEDILSNRGSSPRMYRNMIAFVAPDFKLIDALNQEARRYLAWKSVQSDSEDLNLDAAQKRETGNNLRRSDDTVELRIKEAYCWLLIPYINKAVDIKTMTWDACQISGGNESIITKSAQQMRHNDAIIQEWAPMLLKMELDNLLWKDADNISIKTLWEYLCTYCYLPRLANEEVLFKAIQKGVCSDQYFAYASGISGERYVDLKFNEPLDGVERSGYLVKPQVARKQLEAGNETSKPAPTVSAPSVPSFINPNPKPVKTTGFFMSAPLGVTRIGRDVQTIVSEILNHLSEVEGADVSVTLEVSVKAPKGISQQTIRTVSENCNTMKINNFGFTED